MRGIRMSLWHKVTIAQAVVMIRNVFLDRLVEFIELWSHMIGMSPVHVSIEDMSSLCCCSWLAIGHKLVIWTSVLNFRNHLKLIRIIDNEFSRLTLVRTCSTRNNFALWRDCWNLVIVLLNRWQISLSSRKECVSKCAIYFAHLLVSLTGWLGLILLI